MRRAALALVTAITVGVAVPAASGAAVPAGRDSALAFRPLSGATDRFSVSDLTRRYEHDLTPWSNPAAASARDLAWLDRHGTAWPTPPPTVEPDTTDIDVVDEAAPGQHAEMTPTEKDAAEAPPPPVQVAIPDVISAGLPIIGGLALLVKMIVEMAK
jgi:hypothetical protein